MTGPAEEPMKIIIDTDPGQDDAVALLLALASDRLDILGITAVAGNVPLPLTQKNVRIVCELAQKPGVKVFAGSRAPMNKPLITAEYLHGKSGLDGPVLPDPQMPLQPQHGVDFIVDTILREPPGDVTLCTLGPLTNIGLALQQAPQLSERIKQIVMMGGGLFEGGNVTPAAEFNIYVDPQAAQAVFASGIPIVMMPLDVTHKVLTTRQRVADIAQLGTPVARAVVEMLEFFERYDEEKYGTDGGPLHDPTVIAWLLKPDLFSGRYCNVEIETVSPLTEGMTVIDWWQVTDRPHNALVIGDVDADGFFKLLADHLARL
ncbi:MAG: nucleoside hydrolase [Alphaproteobacteria bacterium]|nr:nucleoside hydrolase [Alphaproteobacteria bacterium]